jgi:hypothetical protein
MSLGSASPLPLRPCMFVTSWCHCVYWVRRQPRELIGARVPQPGVRWRGGWREGARGDEQRAGTAAAPEPGGWSGPWQAVRRGAQPPSRSPQLAVGSACSALPRPRSRSAVGPVHPSWLAPDCGHTQLHQTGAYSFVWQIRASWLGPDGGRRLPSAIMGTPTARPPSAEPKVRPGGGVKRDAEPSRRVSRMYRNSRVALYPELQTAALNSVFIACPRSVHAPAAARIRLRPLRPSKTSWQARRTGSANTLRTAIRSELTIDMSVGASSGTHARR